MAMTQSALAHAMARDFLKAAPPEARVSRLWVWSQHGYIDPERDYVHLSVLFDPVNEAAHKHLLEALNTLPDLYPEVNIGASTFWGAPTDGGTDPREWVHPEAQEINVSSE
jgi:hypothetical protein